MADQGISRDEPGEVPKQFQNEQASAETSTVMNVLGYGPHIRQARIEAYKAWARHSTAKARGIVTYITTGSKAEGLTSYLESDTDHLIVPESVICLEDGVDSSSVPVEKTIFRSCSRISYSGHYRLLLERCGTHISDVVYNALCDDGFGRGLLSSDLYVTQWLNLKQGEGTVQHERAGPSTPRTIRVLDVDYVHALHFYCPSILTRWAARHRYWPSPDVKRSWIATIDEMMTEGPRMILRLPKIRQAIIAHPEPLRWFSGRKIENEMLELICMNRLALGMDEDTDVIIQAINSRQKEILGRFG
ncbi:uncharacterized protein LOC127838126 [Dreissena polymorpha]|uniref:uncharacterized protein LOC127838126 n=1 Tax=Dreissena polymorpha TaxID=45954 RepID=UPI0022646D0C|nr:uncharacterized protein LOC127838126 [Dreissena polymorpha]